MTAPTPVVAWGSSDAEWAKARTRGLGASDVAAALGLSRYRTPWQVWAEKTNTRRPDEQPSAAVELGLDLESWLIERAAARLGQPVTRTSHRLFAHGDHPWRLCSPDGTAGPDLVEAKTAGIVAGWGVPVGWTDDTIPLTYEIQTRWQMHVMDAGRVYVPALVAGLGFRLYTVYRDLDTEAELARQAEEWWIRHIVEGVEPPLGAADTDAVLATWPRPVEDEPVDLDDTDAAELLGRRRDAKKRLADTKTEVEEIDNRLKRLAGPHAIAFLEGHKAYGWIAKRGRIDWQRYAAELAEAHDLELPDPEPYRGATTRALNIAKEYTS